MPLFETVVLSDVMQVITTDDNCSLHLHFLDHSSQDTSTDGNIAGEGAFLVNVVTFNSLKNNCCKCCDIIRKKSAINITIHIQHANKALQIYLITVSVRINLKYLIY